MPKIETLHHAAVTTPTDRLEDARWFYAKRPSSMRGVFFL